MGVANLLGPAAATQHQFDALCASPTIWGRRAQGSTLLKKHAASDHAGATKEFGKWNKANGQVMAGPYQAARGRGGAVCHARWAGGAGVLGSRGVRRAGALRP
jgi:GH24 family phage-related lysozyme (muramidase)